MPTSTIAEIELVSCRALDGSTLCRVSGLVTVNLRGCTSVDEDSLIAMVRASALTLASLSVADVMQVTPTLIHQLTRHCTALTALDLSWCEEIDDDAMVPFLASRGAPLRKLNLRCTSVTGATVRAIGQRCPALQEINLTRIRDVPEADLLALVDGCPALQRADLGWLDNLTDAVAQRLWARAAATIRIVDFEGCEKLAGAAVPPPTCRNLAVVSFTWCTLADADIARATFEAPGLTAFNYYGNHVSGRQGSPDE
jgi:hypothetical protein